MHKAEITIELLSRAKRPHDTVSNHFQTFGRYVSEFFGDATCAVKGVLCEGVPADGSFSVAYLNRKFEFRLTTSVESAGRVVGRVDCYLVKSFPKLSYASVGNFTFDLNGKTDKTVGPEDDPDLLFLTEDVHALTLALNLLFDGLQVSQL